MPNIIECYLIIYSKWDYFLLHLSLYVSGTYKENPHQYENSQNSQEFLQPQFNQAQFQSVPTGSYQTTGTGNFETTGSAGKFQPTASAGKFQPTASAGKYQTTGAANYNSLGNFQGTGYQLSAPSASGHYWKLV